MKIKSIKQVKNLKNKIVLMRCDFDVPLKGRGTARKNKNVEQPGNFILDDARLRACVPTIEFLLKKKVKQIILIGHLGRPDGKVVKSLSLEPVAEYLEKLLRKDLRFTIYDLRIKFIKSITNYQLPITNYQILMLENLRFLKEEQKNSKTFAKKLASLADIYVNEAFAVSHRSESSINAIQNYLPSYAGLRLEQEIKKLSEILSKPKKPLVVIIGGAKIETKLPVIKNFLNKADYILIGGAIANNFLKAQGVDVGKSIVDDKYLKEAKKLLKNQESRIKNQTKILLPVDAKLLNNNIEPVRRSIKGMIGSGGGQDRILDIGPRTIKEFCGIIKGAKTIIWNGPMGYFENKKFANGTNSIANAILKNKKAKIVIGGGETIQQLTINNKQLTIKKNIFVSMGGGAMLEFLAGKKLPGLKEGIIK